MSSLEFKRDEFNVSQGMAHGSIENLNYLDMSVELEGSWLCSLSGFVTKDVAALVLAAPELLSALENLYELVQGECPSLLEDDHHDVMVSAAIAKATRKQS